MPWKEKLATGGYVGVKNLNASVREFPSRVGGKDDQWMMRFDLVCYR